MILHYIGCPFKAPPDMALVRLDLLNILIRLSYFFWENGPILLSSLGFSSGIFVGWYFGFDLPKQINKRKSWLIKNSDILRQQVILQHLLFLLGKKTSKCSHCNNAQMEIWDYKGKLLVVRCTSCKLNFTLTNTHSSLVELIISSINGIPQIITTISANRHELLGKYLIKKLAVDASYTLNGRSELRMLSFTASGSENTVDATIKRSREELSVAN